MATTPKNGTSEAPQDSPIADSVAIGRPRLPRPTRSATPVSAAEIPTSSREGYWANEVRFLKEHEGQYFTYEGVGSSQVSALRGTFGVDAHGRNTREVNRDTGKPITDEEKAAGAKVTKVVDLYVGWRPELAEDIKAGKLSKRGRPTSQVV